MEQRTGQGIHAFLGHLDSRVDPIYFSQHQPERNGASSAPIIFHPSRPILHVPEDFFLPGGATIQGPPPGGEVPRGSLCVMSLYPRRTTS